MGTGVLLIPVVMFLVPPELISQQHSVCLFKNLTGHECYGCGMTRALFSAIHLRFEDAFNYNKLVVVVLPLLIYIWVKKILSLWPGSDALFNIHMKTCRMIRATREESSL
jgi:hypothetical protein